MLMYMCRELSHICPHCTILSMALTSSPGSNKQFPLLSCMAGTSTTSLRRQLENH